jgi:hypothetical protein
MELIEQVARAIGKSDGLNDTQLDALTFSDDFENEVPRWTLYIKNANAAIPIFTAMTDQIERTDNE